MGNTLKRFAAYYWISSYESRPAAKRAAGRFMIYYYPPIKLNIFEGLILEYIFLVGDFNTKRYRLNLELQQLKLSATVNNLIWYEQT